MNKYFIPRLKNKIEEICVSNIFLSKVYDPTVNVYVSETEKKRTKISKVQVGDVLKDIADNFITVSKKPYKFRGQWFIVVTSDNGIEGCILPPALK